MHESEVSQSCPTLRDPMDYSPLGSSACGIFQARVLEWAAIAFSNPGPNIPQRRRGRTNRQPPRGNFPEEKISCHTPFLIGTGIAAALGTKIGGILTSAHFYYRLSQELNEDMEQVVGSFVSIQRHINSLASVALQNRWALDFLTSEKGGACLFLGEDCCYFVKKWV